MSDSTEPVLAEETGHPVTVPESTRTVYVSVPPAEKPRIGRPLVAGLAVGALVGALVGGGVGAGVGSWVVRNDPGSASAPAGPGTITVNDPDDATLVTAIAATAGPSVVTIAATAASAAGTGSGIILSEDGYVLTNAHVVTLDGATRDAAITVTTADGRIFDAEIVGVDPMADLAVIKIQDGSGFDPIEWASSSELNVGDRTVVIGAPLGLANSVSDGIVSALHRGIRIASSAVPEESSPEEGEPDFGFEIPGMPDRPAPEGMISLPVIQTDAAVNPGNSGGALVDAEGRLIGVIVAIASSGGGQGQSGSIGVGFAIPSDLAKRIADELIESGTATHGRLGVTVGNSGAEQGILGGAVLEVVAGEAGDRGGLRVGDVITSIGGIPVTSATDVTAQVRALAAGAETEIGYSRGGSAATTTVTLGALE